jgi:hypothetical protein
LLNKEAIYDAILDGDSPESYTRTIRVWTQASVFAARPSLAAIKVDFQRGGSVQLTREQLDGSVKVRMPVKSFVLQLADEGIYSYRVTVVTMDGIGLPGDPITDSTSDLPITVK